MFHGRYGHSFVHIMDLQGGSIEACHIVPQELPFPLLDREEAVRVLWLPPIATEVHHELLLQLFKKVNGAQLQAQVPDACKLLESHQKGKAEKGINHPLNHHESLVALKMVEWIRGVITGL